VGWGRASGRELPYMSEALGLITSTAKEKGEKTPKNCSCEIQECYGLTFTFSNVDTIGHCNSIT
jgi:hypothetical protein